MTPECRELLARSAAAHGIILTPAQLNAFSQLGDELVHWNRRINLTAITRPEEIISKHFLDSLALVPLLSGSERVLDVGSGAGFPSLPLKIVMPGLHLFSVEAVQKKINFQRHIMRTLGLTGITALHARVESLSPTHAAAFDVVTSRAFSSLAAFATLAQPLIAPAGRLLVMKGPEGLAETEAAADHLHQLGLVVTEVVRWQLPAGGGERSIIVLGRR